MILIKFGMMGLTVINSKSFRFMGNLVNRSPRRVHFQVQKMSPCVSSAIHNFCGARVYFGIELLTAKSAPLLHN